MEAKDTVMTSRDAIFDPIQCQIQRLLIAQAEISFKAGRESILSEVKSGDISVNDLILSALKAGRKEVVEWIHSTTGGCVIEIDDSITELPIHIEKSV